MDERDKGYIHCDNVLCRSTRYRKQTMDARSDEENKRGGRCKTNDVLQVAQGKKSGMTTISMRVLSETVW